VASPIGFSTETAASSPIGWHTNETLEEEQADRD
jgi:hypothetical protein